MNIYAGITESRRGIYTRAVEDAIRNNAYLIIPNNPVVIEDIKTFTKELGLFDQCRIYHWGDVAVGNVSVGLDNFSYLLPELIIAEMLGLTFEDSYFSPCAIYTDTEIID